MNQCSECEAVFDVILYDEELEPRYCPCCGSEVEINDD